MESVFFFKKIISTTHSYMNELENKQTSKRYINYVTTKHSNMFQVEFNYFISLLVCYNIYVIRNNNCFNYFNLAVFKPDFKINIFVQKVISLPKISYIAFF